MSRMQRIKAVLDSENMTDKQLLKKLRKDEPDLTLRNLQRSLSDAIYYGYITVVSRAAIYANGDQKPGRWT